MDALVGILLILHGLVHLLYAGHAWALFELEPDLTWPDGAVVFRRLPDKRGARRGVSALLVLAALGFVLAGARYLVEPAWGHPEIALSAAFSTLLYLALWDGSPRRLPAQGAVAILINLAILTAIVATTA
ncbi:MAG: hypothetical protein EP329_02935 [Deltaproteobacteria bacterium]|nr:MAG: hypothetical protein EP329_02935 [Deltaproteobacteria bacterium]